MALTLLQARTALRIRLDEATAEFWSDAALNSFITEGVKDIARRTEANMRTSGASSLIAAGTTEVTVTTAWSAAIAGELTRISRMEWRTDGEDQKRVLEYRDFSNMDEVWWEGQDITTGKPLYFTVSGYPPALSIRLYPTPADDGHLFMQYYEVPDTAAYADGTTLEVPAGWEDLVLDYAEFRALRTDRDDRWQSAFQVYEVAVERMIEQTRRYVDANGMIVNGNVMLPEWLYGGMYS